MRRRLRGHSCPLEIEVMKAFELVMRQSVLLVKDFGIACTREGDERNNREPGMEYKGESTL